MCGITGVVVAEGTPAVAALYDALLALQHRGQDAAGIVTEDSGRLCLRKENGMVRDVFQQDHIARLAGSVGIGHVRYPTAGSSCSSEAQPFYVNSPFGVTLAHNGNLVNAAELTKELALEWRHLNTGSDSEALLNILASGLMESLTARSGRNSPMTSEPLTTPTVTTHIRRASNEDVLHAAKLCMRRCIGGYAVVAMITGWGIVAFRDPHGIRPLVYGKRTVEGAPPPVADETPNTYEYMVASESGALTATGFSLIGDVPAGHCLLLPRHGDPVLTDLLPKVAEQRPQLAPCVFEYVYFARPDSVLDGISVYRTRLRMGEKLGRKIKREWNTEGDEIDAVIPVPDTARTAALECAATLGIKYREGFIKNRYVGRTFIMPQQGLRKKSVRQKLAPIASEFAGRNVLLVDDSIVRGTTSKEIIQMAREAGARRVYMASAAPAVRYPNVYGIDMPTKEELIANKLAVPLDATTKIIEDQVAQSIGADRVVYQELDDLSDSILEEAAACGVPLKSLDSSCFDGCYVTKNAVGSEYLDKLAATRTKDRGEKASAAHVLDHLELPKKRQRG